MPPIEDEAPLTPDNTSPMPDEALADAPAAGETAAETAPPAEAPKSNLEALTEKLNSLKADDKPADTKPAEAVAAEVKPAEAEKPAESADAERARVERLYTIPPGLKGADRKAYKELADHAQETERTLTAEREELGQLKQWSDGYKAIVDDSKATGEQLALAFEVIHAINHGDWSRALEIIEGERGNIAKFAGKPLPGVDILADFPDLREGVSGLQISEEYAIEIASARRAQAQAQQRGQVEAQQREQQAAAQAYQGEKNGAITAIDAWLKEQAAKDIDHPAKEAALNQYLTANAEVLQNLAPNLWLKHLQGVYASMRSAAPPAPQPAARAPQPLRPRGGGAGAAKTTPSSNREALDRALGYTATA